ncbi:MAG: hypothetical protein AAGI23_19480 [Bacteroidota bacterium]
MRAQRYRMKVTQQAKIDWLLFFSLIFVLSCQAQQPAKYYRQLAEQLLEVQQYASAHDALLIYQQKTPEDQWVLIQLAICSYHLHRIEDMDRFLQQYGRASTNRSVLYTAHLLHAQQKYTAAAAWYKNYLKRTLRSSTPQRTVAKDMLRRCGLAAALGHFETIDKPERIEIGERVPEGRVINSPNYDSIFYFSAIGVNGNTQIFRQSTNETPQLLPDHINTTAAEQLIGFGQEGTWMYFRRGNDIQREDFDDQLLSTLQLPDAVRIKDAQIFADSVILFSSEELGGFGGSDLFYSRLIAGQWSQPINLGATINSSHHESHPFLDKDGCTLYFSSDHPSQSIGGKDIIRSRFNLQTATWSAIQNMGLIINSYADETYFSINSSGKQAYFLSNQKEQKAVYQVNWDAPEKRQFPYFFFGDVKAMQQQQTLAQITDFDALLEYRIELQSGTLQPMRQHSFPDPYKWRNVNTGNSTHGFGQFQSFASAEEWLRVATEVGWEKAKIVVFQQGRMIGLAEAKQLQEKYADLQEYIDYKKQNR